MTPEEYTAIENYIYDNLERLYLFREYKWGLISMHDLVYSFKYQGAGSIFKD